MNEDNLKVEAKVCTLELLEDAQEDEDEEWARHDAKNTILPLWSSSKALCACVDIVDMCMW